MRKEIGGVHTVPAGPGRRRSISTPEPSIPVAALGFDGPPNRPNTDPIPPSPLAQRRGAILNLEPLQTALSALAAFSVTPVVAQPSPASVPGPGSVALTVTVKVESSLELGDFESPADIPDPIAHAQQAFQLAFGRLASGAIDRFVVGRQPNEEDAEVRVVMPYANPEIARSHLIFSRGPSGILVRTGVSTKPVVSQADKEDTVITAGTPYELLPDQPYRIKMDPSGKKQLALTLHPTSGR